MSTVGQGGRAGKERTDERLGERREGLGRRGEWQSEGFAGVAG